MILIKMENGKMTNLTLKYCQQCVGPGWSGLIKKIYKALPEDAFISQVKEKFGGLRFYVDNVTMDVYDLIDECEAESYKICEKCGEPGKPRDGGWILTLCDKCAEEEK